jgi:hypothetical protein
MVTDKRLDFGKNGTFFRSVVYFHCTTQPRVRQGRNGSFSKGELIALGRHRDRPQSNVQVGKGAETSAPQQQVRRSANQLR